MTTTNLTGIDELRERIAASADEARRRAKEVADRADAIEAQRRKDARDAAIVARLLDQQHADSLAIVNEEAEQLDSILNGPAAETAASEPEPEPLAPPAVRVEPIPVAPAPERVIPATDRIPAIEPEPAPLPPRPTGNTFVVFVRWIRGWRILEWVLAILLAFVAFKVSGDHQSFGFTTGFWSHVQHFFWRAGWTFLGFSIGGLIGTWLRPHADVVIAEARARRT